MSESLNNILIIKPSSMGDIIMALPALSALRRSFPHAKIDWLVRPEFAPLLEGHPYLDEIVIFDRKLLGKALRSRRAFSALVSLVRRLRSSRYDAGFDFQGLFRTASLAWLGGCKRRYGMTPTREPTGIFYTNKTAQTQDCVHLVDCYLKMVKAVGAVVDNVEFVLPSDDKAAGSAMELLNHHGANQQNYVILVPSSMHADKCWPIERFAQLADRINSEFGASVIAVGGPSERALAEQLNQSSQSGVTNLAGRTSLKELIALLRTARLVVSNDTGPGHIAAAWGTPVVMIFGRSNPARVAPYGKGKCAAAVEPFGRGMIIDSPDPKHHVNNVTFDLVYQKASELLTT